MITTTLWIATIFGLTDMHLGVTFITFFVDVVICAMVREFFVPKEKITLNLSNKNE